MAPPVSQVSYTDMIHLAREGSPMLINAVGRLAGLGDGERKTLSATGVPGWALAIVAGVAGVYAGIKWHQRSPDRIPGWIKGSE